MVIGHLTSATTHCCAGCGSPFLEAFYYELAVSDGTASIRAPRDHLGIFCHQSQFWLKGCWKICRHYCVALFLLEETRYFCICAWVLLQMTDEQWIGTTNNGTLRTENGVTAVKEKYTMMEFAMMYFRHGPGTGVYKHKNGSVVATSNLRMTDRKSTYVWFFHETWLSVKRLFRRSQSHLKNLW